MDRYLASINDAADRASAERLAEARDEQIAAALHPPTTPEPIAVLSCGHERKAGRRSRAGDATVCWNQAHPGRVVDIERVA